jgi:hypothetical protein
LCVLLSPCLIGKLQLDQALVEPIAPHELGVTALFHDLTALQHDDAIDLAHRGEAMRHDDGGAPLEQHIERVVDACLGLGVDVASSSTSTCGFVTMARAKARSWRSPAEKLEPHSATAVS